MLCPQHVDLNCLSCVGKYTGRWKQLKSSLVPNTEAVKWLFILCAAQKLNSQEAALSMKMHSQYAFVKFLRMRE